ncbi:MAG: hypothetical protein ACLTKV_20135 [Bacteroides xylanisolvens]
MPGVLIVEAMAQCSGILVLATCPIPETTRPTSKIDGSPKRKSFRATRFSSKSTCWNPSVAAWPSRPKPSGRNVACEAVLMAQVVTKK